MRGVEVVVIDYGMGNLLSVRRALEFGGATVTLTADDKKIRNARRVVLPGVGAFRDGMAELRNRGLDAVMHELASIGTPILGICLGMQMLFEQSDEFGPCSGLGLLKGGVVRIPALTAIGGNSKIPHIGWRSLIPSGERNSWDGTILDGVDSKDAFYFVHSYMAQPTEFSDRIADCVYDGNHIAAVVGRDALIGCQFHPEKSGEVGLALLHKFITL